MPEPRDLVEGLERTATLPEGAEERFAGYGVMAAPFAAGHILCMRRFPATSLGSPYTAVWHRDRGGSWTIYSDVSPDRACPRYFGSALHDAPVREIDLRWTGPRAFSIEMPGEPSLDWQVSLSPTVATRAMNVIGGLMPEPLWRNETVLRLMSGVATVALQAGKLGLSGRAPNGQRFAANPKLIWTISQTRAVFGGQDFGPPGAVPEQARLGDFWIPQRGLFAIGGAFFEPFDSTRHVAATSQATAGPN
ncbi:MAG: hypothetical protein WEE64_10165 [Dehalococcoidia bacterium]